MIKAYIKDLILIELVKKENRYRIVRFNDSNSEFEGIGEMVDYSIDNGVLTLEADQFLYHVAMSNVMLKVNK